MAHFIYGVAICLAPVRKNLDVLARYGVRINNAALKGQVNGFSAHLALMPNVSDLMIVMVYSA